MTLPALPAGHRRLARRLVVGACVALVVTGVWLARSAMLDAVSALGRADGAWIALAAGAEVGVYLSLGALLHRLLDSEATITRWTGVRLALVVFGFGGIMPASPAEGVTVATVELHRRGVAPARGAGVLVLSEWVRFLALAVLFAVDLVAAALNGRSLDLGLPSVVASSVAIVVSVVGAALFVRSRLAARLAAALLDRLAGRRSVGRPGEHGDELRATMGRVLGSRPNRLAIAGWAAIGWVADAGCLALCVRALGGKLGPDAVLLAYVIGSAVSLLPLLPGGLGAVEVAVPEVIHHFGVPLDIALAATFAWRGLSLLAPAAAGSLALVDLRRQPVSADGPQRRRSLRSSRRAA